MQSTCMNTRDPNISSPKLDAVVGEMGCLGRDTDVSSPKLDIVAGEMGALVLTHRFL